MKKQQRKEKILKDVLVMWPLLFPWHLLIWTYLTIGYYCARLTQKMLADPKPKITGECEDTSRFGI